MTEAGVGAAASRPPRDASAPGRRELYTSVHRAAECRESPCGVALMQESLGVEALCRYLALEQHVVNILGSDQLHLHRVCQLGPRGDGRVYSPSVPTPSGESNSSRPGAGGE